MKIYDYVESQIKGLWGTDFDENGIPVIKTNNLTYEGNIDYSEICKRNITKEQAKGCYLRPGDLLIEKSGGTKTHSVGYVSYFEGDENKFVCNNFILALRPKNTINSKFLFYQIQFKYESNQFSDCFNKTTGIQNLKVKDYLAKEIKIYSSEEQEKIVKELDTVRSTINKNKQILEKYDTLIKSRFIEMFGDPVTNPKGWEIIKLADSVIALPQNGMYKPQSDYVNDLSGIPILRIDGFYEGKISDWGSLKRLKCSNDDIKKYHLNENDIVINRVNSIEYLGKCAHSQGLKETTVYESNMMRMHFDDNRFNPVYVTKLLCSNFIYGQILNHAKKAVNQASINQKDVLDFDLYVPPLPLQNNFAAFVQQIDKSKFEYTNIGVAA